MAADGSANRLGPGAPDLLGAGPFFVVWPAGTTPVGMAYEPTCQLVGQIPPAIIPTGSPLELRNTPFSDHPPTIPFSARFALPSSGFPLPNGSSAIQNALNRCWTS